MSESKRPDHQQFYEWSNMIRIPKQRELVDLFPPVIFYDSKHLFLQYSTSNDDLPDMKQLHEWLMTVAVNEVHELYLFTTRDFDELHLIDDYSLTTDEFLQIIF